jgi:hypothetical protein
MGTWLRRIKNVVVVVNRSLLEGVIRLNPKILTDREGVLFGLFGSSCVLEGHL